MRTEQLDDNWRKYAEQYLSCLDPNADDIIITASELAQKLKRSEADVRRELAAFTDCGQLRTSYPQAFLAKILEKALGRQNCTDIVMIGGTPLSENLLANKSFEEHGFRIAATFVAKTERDNQQPWTELAAFCERSYIHLGIIATAPEHAEEAAARLASSGVVGIWNVSGAELEPASVMAEVLLENEKFGEHEEIRDNPYVPLTMAAIARQLADKLGWNVE